MQQRDFLDLWNMRVYGFMPKMVKRRLGLNEMLCILIHEGRHSSCLVLVANRAKPNEGYDTGNFSIDEGGLKYVAGMQQRNRVDQAYVALVERYETPVIKSDTALNVAHMLEMVERFERKNGTTYWWVDQNLQPINQRHGRPVYDFPWDE